MREDAEARLRALRVALDGMIRHAESALPDPGLGVRPTMALRHVLGLLLAARDELDDALDAREPLQQGEVARGDLSG